MFGFITRTVRIGHTTPWAMVRHLPKIAGWA